MIETTIELPAESVEAGEDGTPRFQSIVRTIGAMEEEVMVLHAPTGAGKTHALRRWLVDQGRASFEERRGLLVVSPTNALAHEIFTDFAELNVEDPVYLWTADELRARRRDLPRMQHMGSEIEGASAIVTNPDNLHRFTSHAYGWHGPGTQRPNVRPAWRLLAEKLGLLAIDEYHAYEPQLLASILLLVLHLRTRPAPPKILFMSATSDPGLAELLTRLRVTWRAEDVAQRTDGIGHRIRHPIQLRVTNRPILAALPPTIPIERTLFIFDSFTDVLRALARFTHVLKGQGGLATVTGRDTRRHVAGVPVGQDQGWRNANLILATSKVDVGLNIDGVAVAHVEPGWRLAQAWQRLGRTGRDRPASVTLHLDLDDAALGSFLPISDKAQVERLLDAALERGGIRAPRVQEWMARYLAFYHSATLPQFSHSAVTKEDISHGHPRSEAIYGMTRSLLASRSPPWTGTSPKEWTEERWREALMRALVSQRGETLQVHVRFDALHSEKDETTTDDLLYVLRWTNHERTQIDGRAVFIVTSVRSEPTEVVVTYPLFGSQKSPIGIRGRSMPTAEWNAWTRRLERFPGVPQHEDFRRALSQWLRDAGPGTLAPLEAMVDDPFL